MMIPKPKVSKASELCFGCGKGNPIGLKLQFVNDGGIARAEFTPGKFHQGWDGITHGGILYTLLDEASGYAIMYAGLNCITAKSEVRFNCMAPTNKPLKILARITRQTTRLVETEATLSLEDDTTIMKNRSLWYMVEKTKAAD